MPWDLTVISFNACSATPAHEHHRLMLRKQIFTRLCARNVFCTGTLPRGLARQCSVEMRTLANSQQGTSRVASPEPLIHKNGSGLGQHLPPSDPVGVEMLTGDVVKTDWINFRQPQKESAGEAVPYQRRQHSPEAALTTRLKGLVPSSGGGPWRLAIHMLEKGRRDGIKDVKAYNVVLKMMVTEERMDDGKMKEIERLFRQMKEDGLKPEVPTYNSLIHGYALARDESSALRVYHEMVSEGLQPDQRTMSNMIFAQSWGSVEDMRRFLSEMRAKSWRTTRRANNAVISALGRVRDWDGIVKTSQTMLENDQKLSEAAFTYAIKAAASQGEVDFARTLLTERNAARFRPREELYVCVMVALRNADRRHECLSCWRELVLLNGLGDVVINEKTCNLVLMVAVKIEHWEEMEVILDMMKTRNAVPSEENYMALLDGRNAQKPGYITRLDKLLDAAQSREMLPSGRVLLSAAMAYARAKRWHSAMSIFEKAVAAGCTLDRRAMEHLVQTLIALKNYTEIKELWGRRCSTPEGTSMLCARTLERMTTVAKKLGDAAWGLELLSVGTSDAGVHEETDALLATPGKSVEAAVVTGKARGADAMVGHSEDTSGDGLQTPGESLTFAKMEQDKNHDGNEKARIPFRAR